MLNLLFVLTLASSAPNMDPGIICLSARSAAPPEDQSGLYGSCIRSQEAAREQIRQKWAQFPADARGQCAAPNGDTQSYVEVLTCLENAKRQ
jgi:hypothetical protein